MSIQVKIEKGYYRGKQISGTFPLVKPWQDGAKGGFVTIKNSNPPAGCPPIQRVVVEKGDFSLIDGVDGQINDNENTVRSMTNISYEQEFMINETEDEAMERIKETFQMLDKITDACARGIIRGLVVSGSPGIGKSCGVEKQLEAVNIFRTMAGKDPKYEVISGGVSPIGLYQKLYFNRASEQVLLFDDCDGILHDEEGLLLLKAALNSGDKRRICWNKESRTLKNEDIPEAFDFEGSIIFLSNVDFEKTIARGSRIGSHLAAIMSRCHYLDLEITSTRDKLLRVKQMCRDGMLDPYMFTKEEEKMVVDFILNNASHLREISLRMVKKVADFVKAEPTGWYPMAESTCLSKDAKFKRLLERKRVEAFQHGIVLMDEEVS